MDDNYGEAVNSIWRHQDSLTWVRLGMGGGRRWRGGVAKCSHDDDGGLDVMYLVAHIVNISCAGAVEELGGAEAGGLRWR